MALESFYGGKPGISPVIKERFKTIADMKTAFEDSTYTDVWYGELCIIDTDSKNDLDNGKIYRRTLESSSDPFNNTVNAEYIGQIVGPSGRDPIFKMESDFNQIKEYIQNSEEFPFFPILTEENKFEVTSDKEKSDNLAMINAINDFTFVPGYYEKDTEFDTEDGIPYNVQIAKDSYINNCYILDNSKVFNKQNTYYTCNEITLDNQSYESNTYYYENDDSYVLDTNDTITSDRNYYTFTEIDLDTTSYDDSSYWYLLKSIKLSEDIYCNNIYYTWAYVVLSDEASEAQSLNTRPCFYLKFEIPYSYFDDPTISTLEFYQPATIIDNKNENRFYHQYSFSIPRGITGDGFSRITIEDENIYEPNVYYYENNNNYILDTNDTITSNRTYYIFEETTLDSQSYASNTYYYENDNSYILDSSETFASDRTYYKRNEIIFDKKAWYSYTNTYSIENNESQLNEGERKKIADYEGIKSILIDTDRLNSNNQNNENYGKVFVNKYNGESFEAGTLPLLKGISANDNGEISVTVTSSSNENNNETFIVSNLYNKIIEEILAKSYTTSDNDLANGLFVKYNVMPTTLPDNPTPLRPYPITRENRWNGTTWYYFTDTDTWYHWLGDITTTNVNENAIWTILPNDSYNSYILDSSETFISDRTYYERTEITFDDNQGYEPNKYYYEDDNTHYILDTNETVTSGRKYYTFEEKTTLDSQSYASNTYYYSKYYYLNNENITQITNPGIFVMSKTKIDINPSIFEFGLPEEVPEEEVSNE